MHLIKKVLKFIFSKKILKYPPQKKIIVYDSHSKDITKKFLLNDYIILDTRYEKFYLPILLKNFLKFKFSYNDYLQEFLSYVNPKLLITFIDHDLNFYKLRMNSGKKIAIQQSRRSELQEDNFLKIKKKRGDFFKSDFIFTFNESVGKKYSSIVDTKINYLGSFRSNAVKLNSKKSNIEMLYISTYRKSIDQKARKKNSYDFEYMNYEYKLLNAINKYCSKNKKKITILGSSVEYPNEEKLFFSRYFKNNFHYLKRTRNRNTYKIIDKSKVVIGIDSTLIYESLGRGVKSLFFCVRESRLYDFSSRRFSWPLKLKKEGTFWLNFYSEKKIINKINTIQKMNKKKWMSISKYYRKKIMPFNLGNKKLYEVINKTLKD
jgi:surface carbohydrate biosynthesis protein